MNSQDIIHVQNHFMLGRACLKAAKQNNIPIIGTGHFMPENLLEYMPNMLAKRAHRLMWNDFNKFYEQLDYVTSPSFAAQALLRKVGLKNNIEVISNGINLDNFKKVEVSEVDYVKFGLRKDVPTFIFVGRLEADKNVDLIIKATELVLKQKDIQVVIVGIGKDEKTFMKLAQDLNLNKQIIFTGKVSGADLRKLLSLADVYIGSGGAELQGIAVMEGMAMSLPILALNAVALPELVEVNKNGFLFEMDENDLADKMLQIIADESKMKEMGEQSLLLIQKHNQPAIMAKFVNLYESVIANKQIK